ESCSAVPGRPVVHIVRTEELAGFALDNVEGGSIKVGEVHGHALRGAKAAADLLDGVSAAGLRMASGRAHSSQPGNSAKDRMVDDDRELLAILPGFEICRRILNGLCHGCGEQIIEVAVGGRQPSVRLGLHDVLKGNGLL